MTSLECSCCNVLVQVESIPQPIPDISWIVDIFPSCKANLANSSLAAEGMIVKIASLYSSKTYTHGDTKWRYHICQNCNNFIFAEAIEPISPTIVLFAQLKALKSGVNSRTKNKCYSPCWGVILEDQHGVANTILEMPDADDVEKVQLFETISAHMRHYLTSEEEDCKQRIKDYEQQQLALFAQLQARAVSDRKVLWHKLNTKQTEQNTDTAATQHIFPLSSPKQPNKTPANSLMADNFLSQAANLSALSTKLQFIETEKENATDTNEKEQTTNTTKKVNKNEKEEDEEDEQNKFFPPPMDPAPLPPTAGANPLYQLNALNSSSSSPLPNVNTQNALFEFDDFQDDLPQSNDPLNSNDIEEDDDDETEDRFIDDFTPSRLGKGVACSLPMAVPSTFDDFKKGGSKKTKRKQSEKEIQQGFSMFVSRATLKESDFDQPEDMQDQMLSKSFAVPISNTRKIKGVL